MPYVYIGRRNFFLGKTLWEILGNLKDFGVGRLVVRSKFERYPEVTYYKIVHAEPLMDDKNLFGRVLVERVFRGRPSQGLVDLTKTTYKNDFKLVPKDEETFYYEKTLTEEQLEKMKKKLPEFLQFPPLLREMIKKEAEEAGTPLKDEPLLRAQYQRTWYNFSTIEKGSVSRQTVRESSLAPRLYEGIVTEK